MTTRTGARRRCGITDLNRKYSMIDLAKGDVMFAATGVTDGAMLKGVRRGADGATTHSMVMRSKTGTVRVVEAEHNLARSRRACRVDPAWRSSGADDGSPTPYLGVDASRCAAASGWSGRATSGSASPIAQRCQVPEIVGRMLAARGSRWRARQASWSRGCATCCPTRRELKDMDQAAERLADAVARGERIAIFGDYDVDGATSSALLSRFLRAVGARSRCSTSRTACAKATARTRRRCCALKAEGAALVITVDCGITAFARAGAKPRAGLDVIVVDHHVAEPALPAAVAVVNPEPARRELARIATLAAVGVAFLLVIAANRALRRRGWFGAARPEPDLLQWLDLVALGTVCDVVPLTGLNRALVAQGLKVMARRGNLGPRGAGRRGARDRAGRRLPRRLPAGAARQCRRARRPVRSRRAAAGDRRSGRWPASWRASSTSTTRSGARSRPRCRRRPRARPKRRRRTIRICCSSRGAGWHPGVIGIVAGRLKERYQRPVCVIALENGVGKGSGRSVAGLHLGRPSSRRARRAWC